MGFDLFRIRGILGRLNYRISCGSPASQEDVSSSDSGVINEARIMAAQWLLILDSFTTVDG